MRLPSHDPAKLFSPTIGSIIPLMVCLSTVLRADIPAPDRVEVFKRIGDVELHLHFFEPAASTKRTGGAVVFFFGGGWVGGSPQQFFPQCKHLASRGMVAISAEYRIRSEHHTTPFECVRDGKSAVRWVRTHAKELGINPQMIAVGGGSAGGHVAACTSLIEGMNDEPVENAPTRNVSSKPNAVVLFNPVIDTGKLGFGYERLGDRYAEISPLEHVRPKLPPMLILQGDADTTTPPSGHREFERRMKKHKNDCRLILYPGQKHGFFNPGRGDGSGFKNTTAAMTDFFQSIGYLPK